MIVVQLRDRIEFSDQIIRVETAVDIVFHPVEHMREFLLFF